MGKKHKEQLVVDKEVLLDVMREVVGIVVSLDKIGSSAITVGDDRADELLVDFVDKWNVAPRLAHCVAVLSECFSVQKGAECQAEFEGEMEKVPSWSLTSQKPPRKIATYHLRKRR